jgi:phosphopantothenoylcysteine decarboxylase/phosphopantothenate--cysteine ligase
MNRKILLGVTGSIAAYKACELTRLFISDGDEVTVVMTEAATEFVRPLTFQTLSRNPVFIDQFAPPVSWKPEHISLAEAADLVVVAPATANILAKMRYGIADNLLSAVLLATRAPIAVAPAMNTGMWESPVTQENIRELSARGVTVIEPED